LMVVFLMLMEAKVGVALVVVDMVAVVNLGCIIRYLGVGVVRVVADWRALRGSWIRGGMKWESVQMKIRLLCVMRLG